ncbi:hypothetical protein DICVIV_11939 [Dictyocaulus viviparus]|uniref:Fibronectin type III domain protein n=1 Tax=Dictyocaulus viviparus TaxID=29172 RepID=A0A0D8XIC1_DICVI|nr:hypothetical protein DICVIV_11939 [Dictyocaulus viviparus]
MHHLHTLVTVLQTTTAFTVLPYIQIDYAHYFHLAQCQAKCMQKYGILSKRHLLDGSVEEYLDIQSSNAVACESGCHQHRRAHRKELMGQTKNAVADGHRFWIDSSAESAKVGSTLISSVELACQNSSPDEEFGESAEGRIRNFFKVNGFIPGVQYRFMVTAVGPSGRIGETVSSSWAEISNNSPPKGLTPTLTIKNGYNPESGVTAQLVWPSVSLNSCYYKLQLSNSSFHFTTDITMVSLTLLKSFFINTSLFPQDASRSILLTHLEFDTDYSITMAAISSDKIHVGSPVTVNFKSFPCKDVYGRGSLHCCKFKKTHLDITFKIVRLFSISVPEPVTNLAIIIRTNGTGIVSWKPVADPQNVLFYQIIYYALSHKNGCRSHKEIVNVNSTASFAEVNLPGHQCEYVIQLISYDLIGRDALAEARVLIESNLPYSFSRILRPEIVIIIFCLILFLFSYVLYRLRWKRKCPNRVSEKQQKLNDYS